MRGSLCEGGQPGLAGTAVEFREPPKDLGELWTPGESRKCRSVRERQGFSRSGYLSLVKATAALSEYF